MHQEWNIHSGCSHSYSITRTNLDQKINTTITMLHNGQIRPNMDIKNMQTLQLNNHKKQ